MITLTALAVLACTSRATIRVKARPYMTTGPSCGPNLQKRIQDAVLGGGEPAAYQQLAELIMAPSPFGPGDVGHTGDIKLRNNIKKHFSFGADAEKYDGSKPELKAMLDEFRASGMTEEVFADKLLEEVQEVTHLSLQIVEMDGRAVETCPKNAAPGSTHCPNVYHASRDAGYEIAMQLDLATQLGSNPEVCQVMIPGMPPFYSGDKTAGVDYFPVEDPTVDFALANQVGNQHNDAGLHVSVFNRRDAAGLVLTPHCYKVPDFALSKALVDSRQTFEFTLDAERVKLVQGQKRNDHNVGGACYIGIETDRQAVEFVHQIQRDVMPAGFNIDHSQQMHVSIAALGPKDIPHYKSQWALEQMESMDNAQKIAFRKAHFKTYPMLREKMDVDDLTHWGKYEAAAAIIPTPVKSGGINMAYLLVDVLGFKTSVVSPKISKEDTEATAPRTMWNGNWATEALRTNPEYCYVAASIKDWIQGWSFHTPTQYVDDAGSNSLKASVSAAEYLEAVKASYAGKEVEYTQSIIDSLMATIPDAKMEEAGAGSPTKRDLKDLKNVAGA